MQPLPIDPLLPEIVATLARASRLVLRAPPGAGKTTRVPAALLDAGLAPHKHVLVLEPPSRTRMASIVRHSSEMGDLPAYGLRTR